MSIVYPIMPAGLVSQGVFSEGRQQGFIASQLAPITNQAMSKVTKKILSSSVDQAPDIGATPSDNAAPQLIDKAGEYQLIIEGKRVKKTITREMVNNYPNPAMAEATQRRTAELQVARYLQMWREQRAVAEIGNSSNWGTTAGVSTIWSTYASSDPVLDLANFVKEIRDDSGVIIDTLVFGFTPYINMCLSDKVRTYVSRTGNLGLQPILAEFLRSQPGLENIQKVLVGVQSYTTTNPENTSSITRANLWGNYVIGYYGGQISTPEEIDGAIDQGTINNQAEPTYRDVRDENHQEGVYAVEGHIEHGIKLADGTLGGYLDPTDAS